jgi:hypothetical protein
MKIMKTNRLVQKWYRKGGGKMHRQMVRGVIIFLVFICSNLAYAQGIAVGPDGKFSPQTLNLP